MRNSADRTNIQHLSANNVLATVTGNQEFLLEMGWENVSQVNSLGMRKMLNDQAWGKVQDCHIKESFDGAAQMLVYHGWVTESFFMSVKICAGDRVEKNSSMVGEWLKKKQVINIVFKGEWNIHCLWTMSL